eukprot:Sspe_Gene.3634::Locus_1212_Transcript_1_1_Confidence_1.000_Length_717::g.3634::m.3634
MRCLHQKVNTNLKNLRLVVMRDLGAEGNKTYKELTKEWSELAKKFLALKKEAQHKESEGPPSAKARAESDIQPSTHDINPYQMQPGPTADQTFMLQMKKYDTTALQIDQEIATEKANAIAEIEAGVTEIGGMYVEMNDLVKDQQKGLDTVTEKVTTAKDEVKTGHTELTQASKYQKS